MVVLLIVAVRFSFSCHEEIKELFRNGELVEAEVIRIEERGNRKFAPIFRFQLIDGSVEEYGTDLFYGDLFSVGDKLDYMFYQEKPEYSKPKTFVRVYGMLMLALFACLFSLSFVVFNCFKIFAISSANNRFYVFITLMTSAVVSIILGTFTNFEIKRTSNLLREGTQTIGKVIRVDKTVRKGKKEAKFPIFSFTDSTGARREVRQNWSGVGSLKIGDSVNIIYNPAYPTIARRNTFWFLYGVTILFAFLFLGFIFSTVTSFKKLYEE